MAESSSIPVYAVLRAIPARDGKRCAIIGEHDGPVIWLRGERVRLGSFTADLVDRYWKWEQDPAVIIGYGRQTLNSL